MPKPTRHRTYLEVERFRPEFCPYWECPDHLLPEGAPYRYQCRGLREIARAPGIVRRFLCKTCGRSFSSSVFFDCYRRRRPSIPDAVFRGYCEGQSARQIARTTGLGLKYVQLLLRWMARQGLLFHLSQLERLEGHLEEDVTFDGLRTFAGSQWEPGDLNTAVAAEALFWLDVDYAGRRRGGRMTPKQKQIDAERVKRLGKPPRGVCARKCREAFRRLARLPAEGRTLTILSDDDQPTAQAVKQLSGSLRIRHGTISSKVWRELPGHPLWAVNHEHRLARHGKKNHTRETLAFSKTAAGLMNRALLYMVWRNNQKGVSERSPELSRVTPAMKLGLEERPLSTEDIFHRRLFPLRQGLPQELWPHYLGILRSRPGESAGTYRYKTSSAR